MEVSLSDAHAIYRRQASYLLSSNRAVRVPSWNGRAITIAEQSIGRSACARSGLVEKGGTDLPTEGSRLDFYVPSTMIHCPLCGIWLPSGCSESSIRIKSIGRGNTRRRRASRQKAVDFARKKSLSLSGGKKWNENDSVNDTSIHLTRRSSGSCRNAISLSCGSCGTKQMMKGLPPRTTRKKNFAHRDSTPKSVRVSKHGEVELNHLDFVPLPKTHTKHVSVMKRDNQRLDGTVRKGKKGKGKSGLLDFLSSLND